MPTPTPVLTTQPPLSSAKLRHGSPPAFDISNDMSRMYFWTRRMFECDIHVSLDPKVNEHGGLALLMMQASGMQHEDCIEDYALRVSGSMTTVFCEDVRNYHWEFYREIYGDTPTDKVSHGLIKNPWYFPLALQIEDRRWEIDRWYRLDFLEEGPRQRSAVNGFTVIDVTDSPHNNNGPIFTSGRVMLRFMMHTDITGRNFCTLNRPLFTNYKV